MKIPIRAHTLNRTRGLIGKDWDEYKYGIRRSYFHINASPRRFVVDITESESEKHKNKKHKNEIKILNFFKINNNDKDRDFLHILFNELRRH